MKRALVVLSFPTLVLAQAPEKPPVFEAKVDVVAVDVNVIDSTGKPVRGLKPGDFKVTVDGAPRKVLSADFVDFESRDEPEPKPPSPYFSTNEGVRAGRLVLIAVDQDHIAIGNGRAVLQAADRLLDRLNPRDRTALVAFPAGARVEFTAEHQRVREALAKVVGRARRLSQRVSVTEAIAHVDEARNDPNDPIWAPVVERECPSSMAERDRDECVSQLLTEASQVAIDFRTKARASLNMLASIFEGLKAMEGPKTLVLVTEGMGADDRNHVRQVAALASAARVSLFVLQIDSPLFADASQSRSSTTALEDDALLVSPLFDLTSYTRGTIFRIPGRGDQVFERVANELSAYYLLGFEPEDKDRDGKDHPLKVQVEGRQATVRSRARVNIPAAGAQGKDEEILATTMRAPFPATELPVRVATFSARDRASGKVRVLVAAEIAQARGNLVTGFVLVDDKGKVAASGGQRLAELPRDGPASWLGTAVVDPGAYTLKLAVIDGSGHRGSLTHDVKAAVVQAGGLEIGDLVVGSVPETGGALRPAVEASGAGGSLLAHLELSASDPTRLKAATVAFEVAETADGPTVLAAPGRAADAPEGGRRVAQGSIPLDLLPPGSYLVRAVVAAGGKPLAGLERPFRVLPSSRGPAPMSLAGLASSIPRFDPLDLLKPGVLGHFLDRMGELVPGPLPPAMAEAAARARRGEPARVLEALGNLPPDDARVSFLRGIGHLARGETAPASAQFRNAIRLSSTFMPAAVYLGGCYAAAGEDLQASGAWQTALTRETTSAVLYALLSDALLRANQPETAVEVTQEALRAWPDDVGLKRRLGLAQAMAGRRDEALGLLLPYVEGHPEDAGAVFVALRLLFQAFTEGHKPEEKDRLVRYARSYVDAKGPNQEIVATWLRYLQKGR